MIDTKTLVIIITIAIALLFMLTRVIPLLFNALETRKENKKLKKKYATYKTKKQMKLKGNLTILINRDYTIIEVKDTEASTTFLSIELTPEQLSTCLSRQAHVKCELDIRGVGLHTFRHTFASRLVMAGVPLIQISSWLGHKDISMTMIYSHLEPTSGREDINKINFEKEKNYVRNSGR